MASFHHGGGHHGQHEDNHSISNSTGSPGMGGDAMDMPNVLAMKLHGTFMIIGWWIFLPAAMVLARYFRQEMASKLCNSALWFQCHRTMALTGVGCVVAGLVSILVHTKGALSNDSPSTFAHAILGMIAIAGVFIQPIVALVRCNPKHSKRPFFNWFHRLFGLTIWVISQAAILMVTWMPYTGLTPEKQLGEIPRALMIVYWAVILLLGCGLELSQINYDQSEIEGPENPEVNTQTNNEGHSTLIGHAKRIVAKSILYNLILIAAALLSGLIIYFVFAFGGHSEEDS